MTVSQMNDYQFEARVVTNVTLRSTDLVAAWAWLLDHIDGAYATVGIDDDWHWVTGDVCATDVLRLTAVNGIAVPDPVATTAHTLTDLERATVIAALRLWQRLTARTMPHLEETVMATNGDRHEPIDDFAVDALIERLSAVDQYR
jgi:hypothetical protein